MIPQIGTFNSADDLKLNLLPDKFVLKLNHSSGKIIICRDKSNFNLSKEKCRIQSWLKENYYNQSGKGVYKKIKAQIICETFLEEINDEIIDYKFFCMNGKPLFIYVSTGLFKIIL